MKPRTVPSFLIILPAAFMMLGCGPEVYKRADLGFYGGRHGYLDKQLGPGAYMVEVAAIGGYQFINDESGTLGTMKEHWARRASELCPSGFIGEPRVIDPIDAQIDEFRCRQRFCQQYPMVSGRVTCKDASAAPKVR